MAHPQLLMMFNVGGVMVSNAGGICSSSTIYDVVDEGGGCRNDGGNDKREMYIYMNGLV